MDRIPLVSGADRLLGHALELRRSRLALLSRAVREGEIVRLRLVRFHPVLISSPALFQEILVEKAARFVKGPGLRLLSRAVLGNGLLTSEGDFWRRQRKLISPLFHPARIAHYADCMAECTREGAERWKDGEIIDINAEMTRITLSIIGRTLFDADTFNEANDVARALTALLLWMNKQLTGVLPLPLWIPIPSNLAARRANAALEKRSIA